jgi:hypothetical protein
VAREPSVAAASLRLEVKSDVRSQLQIDGGKMAIDTEGLRRRAAGIAFSWILLSLGAPFWFDLLKNLLKLRSVVAPKDDLEREKRTTRDGRSGRAGEAESSGGGEEPEGEAGRLSPAPTAG